MAAYGACNAFINRPDIEIELCDIGLKSAYKNGAILYTSSSTYSNDKYFSNAWSFGARQVRSGGYNGYNAFSGRIAFIAIYTRELTADEILQNYNATKTKFGH